MKVICFIKFGNILKTGNSVIPYWTIPGANPSLLEEKPVTNRLSYGTVFYYLLLMVIYLW
jgi:hypothetical protein